VADRTYRLIFSPNFTLSWDKLRPSGSQLNIAIVDDDPGIREIFTMMISHLGYSSSAFESGTSFVRALAKDNLSFDLVLMDYKMPEMNGIEASKIIQRYRPDLKFVLITAYDFVEKEALANGFLYMRKPLSMETFSKLLNRWKQTLCASPLLREDD
jgi:DNA-binding NtrC family response regulator